MPRLHMGVTLYSLTFLTKEREEGLSLNWNAPTFDWHNLFLNWLNVYKYFTTKQNKINLNTKRGHFEIYGFFNIVL